MRRLQLFTVVMMASVIGLLIAGCGSDPTAAPRPTATPRPDATATPTAVLLPTPTLRPGQATPTPVPVDDSGPPPTPTIDPSFEAEWQRLIAAAQEEGKLFVGGGGRGIIEMTPVYEIFAEMFDIKVTLGRGSGREHAERILAEQAAGRFSVDIAQTGANSGNERFIKNGIVQEVEPFLFHPDVINLDNWFGGKLWWTDATEKFQIVLAVTVSSSAGAAHWWNTNNVPLSEVQGWDDQFDVLADENIGKIVGTSRLVGGATGSDLANYLNPNIGPEWFERFFVDMDVFLTSDFNAIVDGLAKGGYDFAVGTGAAGGELEDLRDQGAPVQGYADAFDAGIVPGLPTVSTLNPISGFGMIMVLQNVPNPNATKLFLNWILSAEGAEIIQEHSRDPIDPFGTVNDNISIRRNVPVGNTDPAVRWTEGETYGVVEMNAALRPLGSDVYAWLQDLERTGARQPRPFEPEEYRDQMFLN